jgi:hypothetical protein
MQPYRVTTLGGCIARSRTNFHTVRTAFAPRGEKLQRSRALKANSPAINTSLSCREQILHPCPSPNTAEGTNWKSRTSVHTGRPLVILQGALLSRTPPAVEYRPNPPNHSARIRFRRRKRAGAKVVALSILRDQSRTREKENPGRDMPTGIGSQQRR